MKRKGFSLVEIMVVIVVVAILSSIAVIAFMRSQKTARDSKRKGEMHTMATSLQSYFSDNSVYPLAATPTPAVTALSGLAPSYQPQVPVAPIGASGNNVDYMYISNGAKFAICVTLETPGSTSSGMWELDTTDSGGVEKPDAPCTLPAS